MRIGIRVGLILWLAGIGNAQADAEESYILHCGGCHMLDGRGAPPEVPGLRELGAIVQVPGGRPYLVQVPGASQAPITNRELTIIVNYILQKFNADAIPDDYPPLTEQEVAAARVLTLNDPLKTRAELHLLATQSRSN